MKKSDLALVREMIKTIEDLDAYTKRIGYDFFVGDFGAFGGVKMGLQILGEAANQLTEKTRERCPSIPWRKIIGLRHRVVHDYSGIDP